MSVDAELELWRREWQSETSVPADLRRRVERHGRFMRVMLLGDVLVTVVIGGGTAAWAVIAPQADMVVLALGTWLFIAAAWIFALVSRRGLWSPSALNTSAFVDLSIRRCRAGIAATTFGTALYFSEMAFCLAWIYHRVGLSLGVMVFVGVCSVVFMGLVIRYRRRKRAEMEYLGGLRLPGLGAGGAGG